MIFLSPFHQEGAPRSLQGLGDFTLYNPQHDKQSHQGLIFTSFNLAPIISTTALKPVDPGLG